MGEIKISNNAVNKVDSTPTAESAADGDGGTVTTKTRLVPASSGGKMSTSRSCNAISPVTEENGVQVLGVKKEQIARNGEAAGNGGGGGRASRVQSVTSYIAEQKRNEEIVSIAPKLFLSSVACGRRDPTLASLSSAGKSALLSE